MPGSDYRSLLRTIDRLYAAAVAPTEWPSFLSPLASLFDADNAYVSQIEHQRRTLDYIGLPQANREVVPVSKFGSLIDQDPRMALFKLANARAVHCRMATTDERLHDSRAYREYLAPLDIEYTMVATFPVREGVTHHLGLTRGRDKPEFSGLDCDLLNELAPHLERCFVLRRAIDEKTAPAPAPVDAEPEESDDALLRQMFTLSPAQAKLTISLFNGASVKQAAETMAITEGSARQYLHQIFDKTGARRQAELVRLIGRALKKND